LNMAAISGPIQSREGSPFTLRKGRIPSESGGAAGCLPEEWKRYHATGASRMAIAAMLSAIHFHATDGATIRNTGPFGTLMVWPLAPLCQVSRSARSSLVV